MTLREARNYRRRIEGVAASQDDEHALETVDLFPRWEADIDVSVDERRSDYDADEKLCLYKCIQAHHTLSVWRPKDTPALWRKVGDVEQVVADEFLDWIRPTGGHDAYNIGDKVTFEGEHYVSTIDDNVWSPSEYPAGWEKVD